MMRYASTGGDNGAGTIQKRREISVGSYNVSVDQGATGVSLAAWRAVGGGVQVVLTRSGCPQELGVSFIISIHHERPELKVRIVCISSKIAFIGDDIRKIVILANFRHFSTVFDPEMMSDHTDRLSVQIGLRFLMM